MAEKEIQIGSHGTVYVPPFWGENGLLQPLLVNWTICFSTNAFNKVHGRALHLHTFIKNYLTSFSVSNQYFLTWQNKNSCTWILFLVYGIEIIINPTIV